MAFKIHKREYNVKIVLFGAKQMEYITVAGPLGTMEEAEKILKELQSEITLDKGLWSISETQYYTDAY